MPHDVAKTLPIVDLSEMTIPNHIGVIMDGNGRWAKQRGKVRTEGHRQGIKSLKDLVSFCQKYSVPYVTVFSFSSENWSRPKTEIDFIFNLLHRFVEADLQELVVNNVRVRILGERKSLDKSMIRTIERVEHDTMNNTGLNLNVAFNYGGKGEIVAAVRSLIVDAVQNGSDPSQICEADIEAKLMTSGMPAPDLMIRTGGEKRLSNFLIWQSAYAELVFLDTYWPDFCEQDFVASLEEFGRRERRFGGVNEVKSS